MVELKDMQYEYALLSARVKLVRSDPTLLSSGGESRRFGPVYDRFMLLVLITIMYVWYPDFGLPPSSIVLRLAQANRFNTAMATARSLDVDMSDLFGHLTGRCLRLSRNPDSVMYACPSARGPYRPRLVIWSGQKHSRFIYAGGRTHLIGCSRTKPRRGPARQSRRGGDTSGNPWSDMMGPRRIEGTRRLRWRRS